MRDILHIIWAEIGAVFLAAALYLDSYRGIDIVGPVMASGFICLILLIYWKDWEETDKEFKKRLKLLSNDRKF